MTRPARRDLTPGRRKAIAWLVPLKIVRTAMAATGLARRPWLCGGLVAGPGGAAGRADRPPGAGPVGVTSVPA
ncbi:hypothetical protein Aph02nite_06220 [Actinoplanes philippinensis]|uniref:Uncharacterized protein n=1 Tax=Actinoplanes philippinensis TaxID=35752 RepID=A0A1I2CUB2_9ACTN|nr:hypothetical protein Aph02nite_06220 [Actinoplanes philippinensis]SFE71916.1 hypothetical protein SAMN05421541_103210 [Actinoplanes philippinensis]